MKPIFRPLAATALLVLIAATPVAAKKQQQPQDIDFGAVTCKEFIAEIAASDEESAGIILMWLDGYLSGVSGDTKLSWKNLESFSTTLMEGCAQKPGRKVLEVAKEVGIN
ncbi:MAG: HdeA/HdeB family chaperone [Solidesulfovibrio sp. DCME]|uniref:HdeA/HdeB family chaperone n=1 Tax=Solidesulfovibrio sp. DCME TaxID=3447380 RepID=UPI003D09E108